MNQQRQKIHELQTLIDNLASGQETVSDKAFEDRLKEAERAVLDLLDEARSSKGRCARCHKGGRAKSGPRSVRELLSFHLARREEYNV